MAGDLSNIIEAGSEFEQMATGFVFTEGPVWDSGYLYFVDIRTNLLLRMKPGEEPEVIRRETGSGDGLTFDHNGNLLMCEGSHRRLTRTNKDTGRIRSSQNAGTSSGLTPRTMSSPGRMEPSTFPTRHGP